MTPAALLPRDPLADERNLVRELPSAELARLSNLPGNAAIVLLRKAAVSFLGRQADGTLGINSIVDSALKSSGGVLNISTGDMNLVAAESDIISMRINVSWVATPTA